MSKKLKWIISIGLVVILVALLAVYLWYRQVARDTKDITTLKKVEQTEEVIQETLTSTKTDFRQANAALAASDKLSEDKQLELYKVQLGNEDAAIRLQTVTKLIDLEKGGSEPAGKLLQGAMEKESDRDVKCLIQGHFAAKELAAAGDDAGKRFEAIKKLAADERPGYRITAAEALGALETPEAKALLAKLVEDEDEDVQFAAEEAAGGEEEEDE